MYQRVYFVTKHRTEAENMKIIIKKNCGIIQSDMLLCQVFPEPPVISFKRCPTLNDKLVHSYLPGDSQKTQALLNVTIATIAVILHRISILLPPLPKWSITSSISLTVKPLMSSIDWNVHSAGGSTLEGQRDAFKTA